VLRTIIPDSGRAGANKNIGARIDSVSEFYLGQAMFKGRCAMLEVVPAQVHSALLYFHSAGESAEQFRAYMPQWMAGLPNTYLWAGDGVISGAPLMRQGAHYGPDEKRYWFTFPMQDASSPESFARHTEAMGATLACGGAYVNRIADQVMARFQLPAARVVLCGFQHGGSMALAASMLRKHDPYAVTILIEPYILEAYYLQEESPLPQTAVVCIENEHIRRRTHQWLGLYTNETLDGYGIATRQITAPGGTDQLDEGLMREAIRIMGTLIQPSP
jgi:predicted esterase